MIVIYLFFFLLSETCGRTFFHDKRPQNVKMIGDLPHDMCLCSYHGNFMQAVESLQKCIPSLPGYKNGFIQMFLCEESTMNCWFGKCNDCAGISIEKLKTYFDETQLQTNVKWIVWTKNSTTKRIEKKEKSGTLGGLATHISALSPQFLRHCFIKREQSNTFTKFDVPRAKDVQLENEGVLQIDFAENFVCQGQDEVQAAHWHQKQLTLFTSALYYGEDVHSKVFVSDNEKHTKDTIVPFLYKILTSLPKDLKILKIWSDGPTSQFKNKFMAAMISRFESEFELKIYWNYFATSHGKGCIDGIGATAKCIVRKHIRARTHIVNNASEFVAAFHCTSTKIDIEEVTDSDFTEINNCLGVDQIFLEAKNVPEISSAHQIQLIDQKIVTNYNSKDGYI